MKAQDAEPKPKKPRKKTKPSALTRPPKKGKKKKNQRKNAQAKQTAPVEDTAGDTGTNIVKAVISLFYCHYISVHVQCFRASIL